MYQQPESSIQIRRNIIPEQVKIGLTPVKMLYSKFVQVEATAKRNCHDVFVKTDTGLFTAKFKGLLEVASGMVLHFIIFIFAGK